MQSRAVRSLRGETSGFLSAPPPVFFLFYLFIHSVYLLQSDSDASDLDEIDSDVEKEAQINYERERYQADLPVLAATSKPPKGVATRQQVHKQGEKKKKKKKKKNRRTKFRASSERRTGEERDKRQDTPPLARLNRESH